MQHGYQNRLSQALNSPVRIVEMLINHPADRLARRLCVRQSNWKNLAKLDFLA
jgi:hypothetical protein